MTFRELLKKMFTEDPNPLRMTDTVPEVEVLSPVEIYEKLSALPPRFWDRYAFLREPLRDRIPLPQQLELADSARSDAISCAQKIKSQYPDQSVEELAEKLGVKVARMSMPTNGSQVLFAQFQKPGHITLFTDCLDKLEPTLVAFSTPPVSVKEVDTLLLAHELYHYIETQDPRPFSDTYRLKLWKLGPFSNDSRVFCLGEIGAMAFAKTLTGHSFEPFLLDVLLVYGYSAEAASNLCNQIMKAAEKF